MEDLKKNDGTQGAELEDNTVNSSDEDDDDDGADAKAAKKSESGGIFKSGKKAPAVEKNKDPLRLAARTRAVADLSNSTVMRCTCNSLVAFLVSLFRFIHI